MFEATQFPCGCRIALKDGVLMYLACSETCDTYTYAVEQARKTGKDIAFADKETGAILSDPVICPNCEKSLDAHLVTGSVPVPPKDDDITICSDCLGVFIFKDNGVSLRFPTSDEYEELRRDPGIDKTIEILRKAKRST